MARASALFFTCYQQKFHLISRKKDVVQSFPAEATHMGRGNLECGVLSMTAHSCPGCAATGTCWEHHICTRPLGEDSKPAAGLTGKLFLGGGRVGASGSFFWIFSAWEAFIHFVLILSFHMLPPSLYRWHFPGCTTRRTRGADGKTSCHLSGTKLSW